jgi:TPP-dependent pyruvate/acetoin dehydrogenase alpha subunit
LLDQWLKRDPIASLEKHLVTSKTAVQAEIDKVARRVEAQLEEDLAWAEKQPAPLPEKAEGGVYGEDLPRTESRAGKASGRTSGEGNSSQDVRTESHAKS